MKISVVTVAHNSAATIGHAVESFLAQEFAASELLVIDGDSSDDTVAIAQGFGDPRIRVHSEPDKGIYDAMNKGFRLFSGDAVGFLNSDDRFHDAQALTAIAVGLAGADIVYGDLDVLRDFEQGDRLRRWRSSDYRRGAFRFGWMAAHPTFYVRRRVVEMVGGFDLELPIAADYDFMLRSLEMHDYRARRIDRVLVDMKAGGASQKGIGAYFRSNLESLKARRRWLGSGPVDLALFVKPARKIFQWL